MTDPPYGIELDSEWRDRAGLNGHGPAEPSYMKKRTQGHTETTISGDTRADWSEAFELVLTLQVAYVWHASRFTREVLDGLLRIGFLHYQQIIRDMAQYRSVDHYDKKDPSKLVASSKPNPRYYAELTVVRAMAHVGMTRQRAGPHVQPTGGSPNAEIEPSR